jgi:hypothetical protein
MLLLKEFIRAKLADLDSHGAPKYHKSTFREYINVKGLRDPIEMYSCVTK